MLRKCFLCLLRELRRILVVCPVTVLGLVCGLFCYDIRTSGGSPGRDKCGYDTYDTYETTKNPRLLVSYRPLASFWPRLAILPHPAATNAASKRSLANCLLAARCQRSSWPRGRSTPFKFKAPRRARGGYARARRWPRTRHRHSSWNYLNMSPAGIPEQDRVEKAARSRSAARGSSAARRCEDVNSAQKKVVYLRARRTLWCSIHRWNWQQRPPSQ